MFPNAQRASAWLVRYPWDHPWDIIHRPAEGEPDPDLIPCENETCTRLFRSQILADRHMWAVNHYRNRCRICHERFPDADATQHMTSGRHRVLPIHCPFCYKEFIKTSVLYAHLENGRCPRSWDLNHHSILRLLRNCDPNGVIVNWNETSLWVKQNAPGSLGNWHGDFSCTTCRQAFRTAEELEWHVAFPMSTPSRNAPRFYKCPNCSEKCEKTFVDLAALFKHLESQSCKYRTFEQVQVLQQQLTVAFWGCGI